MNNKCITNRISIGKNRHLVFKLSINMFKCFEIFFFLIDFAESFPYKVLICSMWKYFHMLCTML